MRKLNKDEIDVKVKQVSEKGAVLLLYKTARVDMAILDETYGAMNWQSDYKVVKDNLYCGIGVYNQDTKDWVWKWDCGIESREDEEGNQKKGEASDAFKRAGYKWGIGVELYSAPFTFATVETVGEKGKDGKIRYSLKNKFQKFFVDEITYDEKTGDIKGLVIVDDKGVIVYSNVKGKKPTPPKQEQKPTGNNTTFNDELVKKRVAQCMASIEKHEGKYEENGEEFRKVTNFANKVYELGYQKEANEIIAALEAKTEKDSIPY